MTESNEERAPEVGEHDEEDQRGGGGGGGLSGAAPGVGEKPTPEGETSVNEAEGGEPPAKDA